MVSSAMYEGILIYIIMYKDTGSQGAVLKCSLDTR